MRSQHVSLVLDYVAQARERGDSDRLTLSRLATHYNWTAGIHSAKYPEMDNYRLPNGVHVRLRWAGDALDFADRGTRDSVVSAEADAYSSTQLVHIAAMFLSDTE